MTTTTITTEITTEITTATATAAAVLTCIVNTGSVPCVLPLTGRVSTWLHFMMQVALVTLELVCTRPSIMVTLYHTKVNLLLL